MTGPQAVWMVAAGVAGLGLMCLAAFAAMLSRWPARLVAACAAVAFYAAAMILLLRS